MTNVKIGGGCRPTRSHPSRPNFSEIMEKAEQRSKAKDHAAWLLTPEGIAHSARIKAAAEELVAQERKRREEEEEQRMLWGKKYDALRDGIKAGLVLNCTDYCVVLEENPKNGEISGSVILQIHASYPIKPHYRLSDMPGSKGLRLFLNRASIAWLRKAYSREFELLTERIKEQKEFLEARQTKSSLYLTSSLLETVRPNKSLRIIGMSQNSRSGHVAFV